MKTLLLFLMFTSVSMLSARTHYKRFNISIGTSTSTLNEIGEEAGHIFSFLNRIFGNYYSSTRTYTPLFAEIHYTPHPSIEIGFSAMQQKFRTKYYNSDNGNLIGESFKNYNTFMLGIRANYTRPGQLLSLSSGLYLGENHFRVIHTGITDDERNKVLGAFQIDVLGFRASLRNGLGIHGNFGFGNRGIASGGLCFTF